MPYEFDLQVELNDPVSDGEGGYVFEFALGFDVEIDLIVVMAVMLTATDRPDALELHFGITKRQGMEPPSAPDYTREAADAFIPKEHRARVLDMIRRGVAAVVGRSQPDYILMETYYGNLPPKAVVKYYPICERLIESGYILEQAWRESASGKDYWVFRRFDASSDVESTGDDGDVETIAPEA